MKEIHDIQTYVFWFFYSLHYFVLLAIILFFVCFYIGLQYYFHHIKPKNEIEEKIEDIEDDGLKQRFHYLLDNVRSLERHLFYREVWIFLKFAINKQTHNPNIFYMTLQEIKKHITCDYNDILEEVYYLEFDKNRVDNLEKRYEILKKIEM